MSNKRIQAVALGISADTTVAQRELRQMNTILRQTKDPANDLQQVLRHLNQAFKEGEIDQRQFADAIAKAELKAEKQRASLTKLRSEYDQMLVRSKEAAELSRKEATAKEELARATQRAEAASRNRDRGLGVKAGIDRERQAVEEHRKELQKRLTVFKKEKAERESLAATARKQAADQALADRTNANQRRGRSVQSDIQRERDAVQSHRKELQQRLVTFKKERAEREQLARAAREQAAAQALADRTNANRRRGLGVQADVQRERDAVDSHRRSLQERLTVFKREKREREELARVAREQAAAQALADRTNRTRRRGQQTQADIQGQNDSAAAARDARTARLQERVAFLRQNESAEAQLARRIREVTQLRDRQIISTREMTAEVQRLNAARRNEVRQEGLTFLRQFETAQQATNRQIAEANRLHRQGSLNAREHAAAIRQIRRANSVMVQGFQQAKVAVTTLLGPLVLVTAAYEGIKKSIKLSAELDAAKAKFEVFTGSVEDAEKKLKQLREFSSSAPVSFAGGQRAIATMLQFGVSSDRVFDSFKQIAEITAGDTQRMESLALAYAQAQAAGRLMGQELLQMVNAGFNPLKVISEQTGRSLVDLKKDMEAGAISSEMVAKAFRDATAEGGKFNGLLDKVAETSFGQIVKAANELEKFGTSFGKLIEPSTVELLKKLTNELKTYVRIMDEISRLSSDALGGEESTLSKAAGQLGTIATSSAPSNLERVYQGVQSLFVRLGDEAGTLEEKISRLQNEVRTFGDVFNTIQPELDHLTKIADARKVTIEQFRELKQKYQEEIEQLEATGAAQDKITQKFVDFKNEVGDGFFSKDTVDQIDRVQEGLDKIASDRKRLEDAFGGATGDAQDRIIDARYGDNADNVRLLQSQATGDERVWIDALIGQNAPYEMILDKASKTAQEELKRLNTLQALADSFENQNAATDKRKKEEEDAAKKAIEDAEKKQKAFDDQKKSLENQLAYQRDLRDLTRDEAEIRKRMREDDLTRQQAEELRNREKSIEDLEKRSSAGGDPTSSSAPRAIQAGSSAAFAAIADKQSKLIQEQVRLQREQLLASKRLDTKAGTQVTILRDISEKPGVLPA